MARTVSRRQASVRDAHPALGKLLEVAVAMMTAPQSPAVPPVRWTTPEPAAQRRGSGDVSWTRPVGLDTSGPAITPPWKASALEAESQPSADQTQCTMTG